MDAYELVRGFAESVGESIAENDGSAAMFVNVRDGQTLVYVISGGAPHLNGGFLVDGTLPAPDVIATVVDDRVGGAVAYEVAQVMASAATIAAHGDET